MENTYVVILIKLAFFTSLVDRSFSEDYDVVFLHWPSKVSRKSNLTNQPFIILPSLGFLYAITYKLNIAAKITS